MNTVEEGEDIEEGEDVFVERVYARGRTTFMGLTLHVGPGTIVPRAETEILCRAALDKLARHAGPVRVVDMCCGSGNLACAIATYEPRARVWAADLTHACAELARTNVAHLGVADRVSVHQGDLFAALSGVIAEGSIDLVVCNPPYISTHRLHKERKALLAREPREAFDGGAYGLTMHQRVIARCLPFLKPSGWLLFEVGLGQARQVERLFERSRAYGRCEARADVAGNVRVIAAQKNRAPSEAVAPTGARSTPELVAETARRP